jgi:hypothetical protein
MWLMVAITVDMVMLVAMVLVAVTADVVMVVAMDMVVVITDIIKTTFFATFISVI